MDKNKKNPHILDTARKRILYFIESQGIKPKEFLQNTGLKKGIVDRSHHNSGTTDLILSQILDAYPDISALWLINGKGPMLNVSSNLHTAAEPTETYGDKKSLQLKGILFEDQDQINSKLDLLIKKVEDMAEMNNDVAYIKEKVLKLSLLEDIANEIKNTENGN